MTDSFGRYINYLRFSLTQRCQLQCAHCAKSEGKCIKDSEPDTATVLRLSRIFASLGFDKIRFTGGEPLLRKDLPDIIHGVHALGAYRDIALTTNAQLLAQQAKVLKDCGLHRVNISLNSLKADRSKQLYGADLQKTFAGIEAAFCVGLTPLKINCVILKGQNDDEIADFIRLAKEYPVTVRFIELMPMGESTDVGVSGPEILSLFPALQPIENTENGVAVYYAEQGAKGKIGFIDPISSCFCSSCSRMRITSDCKLRPCLGDNREISLTEVLQQDDDAVRDCIVSAIRSKPQKNCFSENFQTNRTMNKLGG